MSDKYTWVSSKKNGVDIDTLKNSKDKKYNCATYAKAKSENKSPDCNDFYEVDELVTALDKDATYKKFRNGDSCGCENQKLSNCIVIYYDLVKDEPGFHVAAFDAKRKDWGGKISSTKPIVRFSKPEDYKIAFMDKDEAKKTGMKFYCKEKETCQTQKVISDVDLHENAKNCD